MPLVWCLNLQGASLSSPRRSVESLVEEWGGHAVRAFFSRRNSPQSAHELSAVMILLLDIGNTHTHLGLADERGIVKRADIPTAICLSGGAGTTLERFVAGKLLAGAAACSVVPRATPLVRGSVKKFWEVPWLELTPQTLRGLGLDYPRPETIGPDRLASALAARHHYGAPCLAIGFGTAVTFNVVDRKGNFIGGAIAPGLALMTRYLHEKTALLPEIELRDTDSVIGRSTEESLRAGAVFGFRGLVREIVKEVKKKLRCRRLPVVTSGGYAELVAPHLPEITFVHPSLTLEGLRLAWLANEKFQVLGSKLKVVSPTPDC